MSRKMRGKLKKFQPDEIQMEADVMYKMCLAFLPAGLDTWAEKPAKSKPVPEVSAAKETN